MVRSAATVLALVAAGSVMVQGTPIADVTGTHPLAARAVPQDYLTVHNNERAKHGAQALVWDADLATSAQGWADTCAFWHSRPEGESLYYEDGNTTVVAAIGAWNAESKDYNLANPLPSRWTQVVWKGTTKVGCGLKQCTSGGLGAFPPSKVIANYYVCHYSPAGNVVGQFLQNVQK